MIKNRLLARFSILIFVALATASCGSTRIPAPTEASSAETGDVLEIGEVVETGDLDPTLAETEFEHVCNCGIVAGTMTKNVERSYTASYAFSWEFGGEIGFDLTVEPLGVGGNVGAAVTSAYGRQWESSRTQTVGFPLTAEPNTNMEYTITWTEMWQNGYIPVHTRNGEERVVYRYLVCIDGDIVDSRDLGCEQGCEGDNGEVITPSEEGVPEGYVLYDDFTAPEAFDTNWWIDDPNGICTLGTAGDVMRFDCRNDASDNLLADFHHSRPPTEITGLAAMVGINRMGGPFQVETLWNCQETGEQRAYHLAMAEDSLSVNEYYPQEGWRMETLGEYPVTPGEAHLLQMERTANGPRFSVDGQSLTLNAAPDWQDCFSITDWGIPFYIWPDNSLEGWIEWVAVR